MGRTYQGQDFALGLNILATKALDTREVIDTADDRLLPDTWLEDDGNYYVYPGMETRCADTGDVYIYIGEANDAEDIASEDCWVKVGSQIDVLTFFEQICPRLTLDEYEALETKQKCLYFIINEKYKLIRVYYGTTLIARCANEDETITIGFPYEIPILF